MSTFAGRQVAFETGHVPVRGLAYLLEEYQLKSGVKALQSQLPSCL